MPLLQNDYGLECNESYSSELEKLLSCFSDPSKWAMTKGMHEWLFKKERK